MRATSWGSVKCARLLIDRGANVKVYDKKEHKRAFHHAVINSKHDIATLLMEKGISPKTVDGQMNSAKMYAIISSNSEMRRILSGSSFVVFW